MIRALYYQHGITHLVINAVRMRGGIGLTNLSQNFTFANKSVNRCYYGIRNMSDKLCRDKLEGQVKNRGGRARSPRVKF